MDLRICRIWRDCMEEWSLISCQGFSKLIRHYRRRLRAVIMGKGDCKKVFNKRGQIIVAHVFWRKKNSPHFLK